MIILFEGDNECINFVIEQFNNNFRSTCSWLNIENIFVSSYKHLITFSFNFRVLLQIKEKSIL